MPVSLAPIAAASFFAFSQFSIDLEFSKQKRYSGKRDGIF